MLARRCGSRPDLRVCAAGDADADHLDVRTGEKCVTLELLEMERRGEVWSPLDLNIRDRNEARIGQVGDRPHMKGCDHTAADDSKSEFAFRHARASQPFNISANCGRATSGSASSGCQRFSHSTESQPE